MLVSLIHLGFTHNLGQMCIKCRKCAEILFIKVCVKCIPYCSLGLNLSRGLFEFSIVVHIVLNDISFT